MNNWIIVRETLHNVQSRVLAVIITDEILGDHLPICHCRSGLHRRVTSHFALLSFFLMQGVQAKGAGKFYKKFEDYELERGEEKSKVLHLGRRPCLVMKRKKGRHT